MEKEANSKGICRLRKGQENYTVYGGKLGLDAYTFRAGEKYNYESKKTDEMDFGKIIVQHPSGVCLAFPFFSWLMRFDDIPTEQEED